MRGGRGHGRHGYRAHVKGHPLRQGKRVDPAATLGPNVAKRHALAPAEQGAGREEPRSHFAHRVASKLHGRRGRNYDTHEG